MLADEVADLPPLYWHLVVKNGDFTFLLLELILSDEVADVLADLCPKYSASWDVYYGM